MAGERVLVVAAAADLRQFVAAEVLPAAGYDVLTAASGREGLILARDLRPDLVIAGHQLPDLGGLDLLRALGDEGIMVPFILMVAGGSEALAVQALRAGVSDYLIEAFEAQELVESARRVLRQHWARQIAEHVPTQLLQSNRLLEERLRELDTLVEIGKRVTGQLDLPQVLNRVVEAAVGLAGAEEGTLLLVDQPSGELYLYASTREDIGGLNGTFRLPVADSLAGQVVQTGQPLVITGDDLRKIKTHYLFRDLVYVPLRLKDNVVGVLGITNRETSAEFKPHTLQLLHVLADFAAIAIENARLYAATEQERNTLNTILRDTEDAIIVVDQHNRVLFCNPAACRTFDIEPLGCQGARLEHVIDHPEVVELFRKEARSGRSRRSEIALDNDRYLNAQLTILKDVGRIVVMQDITHLKELDRIKSDFVTAVSHDLRSPLTAILGYVELLVRSGPLNEHQQAFVERITFSVKSITALISELLELGKIEAGFDEAREPVSLSAVVNHAVESQRHQWEAKGQVLQLRVVEDVSPVLGNPLHLRQLVVNLLENAVKYTPEHGQITLSLDVDGDFVVLRVTDTGIGIPQKDLPYIFDKFFRTDEAIDHYVGTGLGLSIVKGIVDQHHGRIWAESQMGAGSVFTVMLPCYDEDSAEA